MAKKNMQCTLISDENRSDYRMIIPEDILKDEELIKLGIIDEDGVACAGCAVTIFGNMAYIEWLYTDPDFREKGAASMLMDEVSKLLDGLELDGIEADFFDEDENLEEFFMEREFLTGEESDVYRVPITDLLYGPGMEYMLENRSKDSTAFAVDDNARMKALVDYFEQNDLNVALLAGINPPYSMARCDDKGHVSGCLLTGETGENDLRVHYFKNMDTVKGAADLIVALYDALENKEVPYDALEFTDRNELSVSFVEKLSGFSRDNYREKGRMHAVKLFA